MTTSRGKQIAKNTLLLYSRMFLVMGIGLYTSRVILQVLGVEDFGIYNIVGTTIILFSFFSNSLTAAVQRYMTFALGKNDINHFNVIFNQGFWSFLFLAAIVLILSETVGLYILYNFIEIPTERFNAAFWVYQLSIISFIINILRIPYNASMIAYEKMSFFAYMGIVEVLLKLLIVFCIDILPFDKLIVYSLLIGFVSLVILILHIWYCLTHMTGCKLKAHIDIPIIKELLSFSGWTLLSNGSQVVSNQGINIVLNNFFGVIVNAATGIANQIMNAYTQFLGNFQIAFNPQIVKSYASGDIEYFRLLLYRTSVVSFYLMLLIATPVIVKMDYILSIWLVTVPPYTKEFSIYLILYLMIESYSGPLWMAVQAVGKIRRYQIIISSIYALNFVFGVVFLYLGYPPVSVFLVKILVSLLVLLVRAYLLKGMINISLKYFFCKVVLRSISIFLLTFSIVYYIGTFRDDFWGLFFVVAFSIIFTFIVILFVGFANDDRKIIMGMICKYLRIK